MISRWTAQASPGPGQSQLALVLGMVSCDRAGFPVPRQRGCRSVTPSPGRSLRTGSHSSLWGTEDEGAGCPRVSELPCACFLPFQNIPPGGHTAVTFTKNVGACEDTPCILCFPGHEHCIPTCCKVLWAAPPLYRPFIDTKEAMELLFPPPPLWGTKRRMWDSWRHSRSAGSRARTVKD